MVVFFVGKTLAFGSKATRLRHVERLRALGITHIIDVRKYRAKKLDQFKRICLNFKDDARPRPQWFYSRALAFYKKAMRQSGSKVFVMCRAGRRRSANTTYFLLRASGGGPNEADTPIVGGGPARQVGG